MSDEKNSVNIFGLKIKEVNKKTAEEIFDELRQKAEEESGGKGKEKGRFDVHFEGKDGKELTEKQKRALEKEWADRTHEALTISKMRGNTPEGIERIIGKLHEEKINWKALLYQFITRQIPYNFSWAKPHKKSVAVGEYMPDLEKEKVEVVIGIDLSGSIGQEELNDFISEVVGIARAFQERIDMRLLTHETSVNNDYMVRNGSVEKIKQLKINGGGGTSHKEIFEFIKNNVRDCKCTIFFTDGFSDLNEIDFSKYGFEKIFLLSKNASDEQLKDKKCHIIKLKD